MKNIQKIILGFSASMIIFSATKGMENEQIKAEVDK